MFDALLLALGIVGVKNILAPKDPPLSPDVRESLMRMDRVGLDGGYYRIANEGFLQFIERNSTGFNRPATCKFPFDGRGVDKKKSGIQQYTFHCKMLDTLGMTHEEFIIWVTNLWFNPIGPLVRLYKIDGQYYQLEGVTSRFKHLYDKKLFVLIPIMYTKEVEEAYNRYARIFWVEENLESLNQYFEGEYTFLDCGCSVEELMKKYPKDILDQLFGQYPDIEWRDYERKRTVKCR